MSCTTRKLTIVRTGYTSIEIEEHPTSRSGFYLWMNPSDSLSEANIEGTETKKQAGHGVETGVSTYGPRTVPIDIEMVAASHSALVTMETNIRKILALPAAPDYSDDGFLLYQLDDEDGTSKQFYARIIGSTPSFDMIADPSQRRRRLTFTVLADDPVLYSQTLTSGSGPESFVTTEFALKDGDLPALKDGDLPLLKDTTGSVMTVTNNGTIGVVPEIIITGPSTNPVVTNVTTGKKLAFTRGGGVSLVSGEYITVSVANKTAVKTDSGGSESNVAANLSLDSNLTTFVIVLGDNNFTLFDDTSDALDGQLQVKFRDGFI
ncbi:Phage tail protein [Symmachiella dynata]|uniref:phage tail domain-containing protein n=1 Tax=Symmachiella dynata TaxID=2527995 RepID=UPI00118C89F3|nr:phage tail domain-containing protein [Symmachiella dynata]QDT46160.1 Phage tail protein [Symmachiella dynata]